MSKIKEIWCMPHSHLDIGYTHPQPLLLELQSDYINQAIDICSKTRDYPEESRFRWTIEANYVLKRWLKEASAEQIRNLKDLIKEGRICVTALPMHTTPNCNVNEMVHMLADLNELRDLLETDITVAINHDVNGQPLTIGQVMLNSGINFYLTGINIHFGGIPFKRLTSFLWEMSDGRKLHSFLGEHYSLFSQFLYTHEHSTARMHEGALQYINRLEQNGYTRDFAFLTATNPPLYDNNCPDLELSDLIRKYNEEDHEIKIRIVTAEMLRDKLLQEDIKNIPIYKGDWTDYWNFGCGSTARETRVSRLAKQTLQKAETMECFLLDSEPRYKNIKEKCYENIIIFDEHTWGAAISISEPDSYETYSQLIHKVKKAYNAADLSGYLLGSVMERLCNNPHQSNELGGIVIVNTSEEEQEIELNFPKNYLGDARRLSALRTKAYVPYIDMKEEMEESGLLTLKPFSYRIITFEQLNRLKTESLEKSRNYSLEDTSLTTPFYKVIFDEKTKRIKNIFDIVRNKNLLDEDSGYSLFEPIRETIDEDKNPALRSTLFPRDVDLGNQSISQWNHDWIGKRTKPSNVYNSEIIQDNYKVTFITHIELEGTRQMVQRITFYTYSARINMKVSFIKNPVPQPESIYFAIPLHMNKDWECSYDTAGEFVKLDDGQMGNVCKDWLTVDTSVSVYDEESCISLACPDAPLVQVGGFNFGKENSRIERNENPLLLAWTLNNYWDTNFMADQSGQMQFAYDLFTYDSFQPKAVLADGIKAQNPCVIGASVAAEDVEGYLLEGNGKASILNIYPSKEKNSINVLLKNMTDEEDNYVIDLKRFKLLKSEVITVQEEALEPLEIRENRTCVVMRPREFKMIRIMVEAYNLV